MKTKPLKKALLVFLAAVMVFPLAACKKSISQDDSKKLMEDAKASLNKLESYSVSIQRDIVLTHNTESLYNNMEKFSLIKGKNSVSLTSSEGYINSWYYKDGIADLYIDGDGYEAEMSLDSFLNYIDTLGMSGIGMDDFTDITGTPTDSGTILTLSDPNGNDDLKKRLLSLGISGFEYETDKSAAEMVLDQNGNPVSEKISYTGKCKVAGETLEYDLAIVRKYSLEKEDVALADTENNSYLKVGSIDEVTAYNNAFTNLLMANFDASFAFEVLISQQGSGSNGDLIKEAHNYVQNVSGDSFSFCDSIQLSSTTDPTAPESKSYMEYEDGVLTNVYNGQKSTDDSSDPYTMLYFVTSLYGRFTNSYAKMKEPEKTVNRDGDSVYTYTLDDTHAAKICGDMAYTLYGGTSDTTLTNAKRIDFEKNSFQITIDKKSGTVKDFTFFLNGSFDIESTVITVELTYSFTMNQFENGVKVVMPE